MALSDLIPEALRPQKANAVPGPSSPRVSGVADDAITPIPEGVEGTVFAYRGTEQHGVPVHNGSSDPQDPRSAFLHTVDVEHVVNPHPPTPVLVKVVEDDGKETRDWRVVSSIADSTSRMVLNRQDSRYRTVLHNSGAVTVFITRSASANSTNGFPIPANSSLELLHTTEEVWATSVDGSACDIRALIEFSRG